MKIIPHYKVIGPYNYDRIIHNIENNYSKKQDYRSDIILTMILTMCLIST